MMAKVFDKLDNTVFLVVGTKRKRYRGILHHVDFDIQLGEHMKDGAELLFIYECIVCYFTGDQALIILKNN